jgi:hypothetical protein
MAQAQRLQVLQTTLDGHITNPQAADALHLSVRQVRRLKGKVLARGPAGVLHGNAARTPHNRLPETTRRQIVQLATTSFVRSARCKSAGGSV